MSFIEFKHIGKKYAGAEHKSVDDFNLNIEEKEFIAFVGPSGCGKSTTLRMIAGFEEITEGDLYIDGKRVNETAPRDRGIAMVFQNYALYPHMTVEKNIGYGLKNMKMPADQIKKKVDWAIDILGLQEFRYRKPKNLSGGQRQRVALGRAIVKNQKVFLMDEPLSNLDAKLRVSMRTEISKLHREMGATTIYVTHDQVEAIKVHVDADTVNDATAFLETFFKLYPTATEKELAYYISGNVLEPIGRDYLYSELVNPTFTKDGDNVKVKVAVKFLDNQTKVTQVSQYELVLHKDSNWKIVG